jgi:hypothetical protein
MNSRLVIWLGLSIWALGGSEASAHFLFVRIGPPAEAGRFAEVYFSELAEAGDPRFIDKVAHTQLWVQTTPGEFHPLKVHKAADRLRAFLPASGSVVVVGVCEYGVLARPNRVSFLLRHYPKAMAGSADDLNRMKPCAKVPFEVTATLDGERIHFVALREGKPVPRAKFVTVASDLSNEEVTADADGRATWKPPAPDAYSVYTRSDRKETGQVRGQDYTEVREFATLAFTWPVEREGPDPKAVALFQEAVAARAQWRGFPGFTARIVGTVDGRPFDGRVTIKPSGEVHLETEETLLAPWVREQLESIAMHRNAAPQPAGAADEPKPVLRFADRDSDHPLGRLLLFEGGRFASSYRVKDQQITVVNRRVGNQNLTITVLDNERNPEGFFLPRSYVVQYWDAATGQLRRTETVHDRWLRVGTWDLPAVHTVTAASEMGLSVRSFSLSKHELLTAK